MSSVSTLSRPQINNMPEQPVPSKASIEARIASFHGDEYRDFPPTTVVSQRPAQPPSGLAGRVSGNTTPLRVRSEAMLNAKMQTDAPSSGRRPNVYRLNQGNNDDQSITLAIARLSKEWG